LGVEAGERVLAAAEVSDGTWVVATDRALLTPGLRVPWVSASHAEWDDDASLLTVDELGDGTRAPRSHRIELLEPGLLPETVHERVVASIVVSRHVRLNDRSGVRVVARRSPGSDDLRWQVVVDAGLDPDEPRVRVVADRLLTELRREVGDAPAG
jgi:hypothetical protein